MSVEEIFENAFNIEDERLAVDYIFENLSDDYCDEEIILMMTNKLKKIQCGGGISSTLGWAKKSGYEVVVENPYEN